MATLEQAVYLLALQNGIPIPPGSLETASVLAERHAELHVKLSNLTSSGSD